MRLKEDGYTEVLTKTTIYSAIDRGLIPNVTREILYTRNATVFSDGMIHLPKWVREKLSINDGDNLSIRESFEIYNLISPLLIFPFIDLF